jgi:hypothetical protein
MSIHSSQTIPILGDSFVTVYFVILISRIGMPVQAVF